MGQLIKRGFLIFFGDFNPSQIEGISERSRITKDSWTFVYLTDAHSFETTQGMAYVAWQPGWRGAIVAASFDSLLSRIEDYYNSDSPGFIDLV